MSKTALNDLISAGILALGQGEVLKALALFERAAEIEKTPTLRSCLAYCKARERGQTKAGRLICEELIENDPDNLFHYLNLGRIFLLEDNRRAAIAAFRAGIVISPHPQLIRELNLLGVRRPHIISFLRRDNLLNKYLGLLCGRGLRRDLDSESNRPENK
jgi:tetratricopeptide (TPR) repeat protein